MSSSRRVWDDVRDLFRQAWESPSLQRRVQALRLDYGEHA
jgi:hypothetical protein